MKESNLISNNSFLRFFSQTLSNYTVLLFACSFMCLEIMASETKTSIPVTTTRTFAGRPRPAVLTLGAPTKRLAVVHCYQDPIQGIKEGALLRHIAMPIYPLAAEQAVGSCHQDSAQDVKSVASCPENAQDIFGHSESVYRAVIAGKIVKLNRRCDAKNYSKAINYYVLALRLTEAGTFSEAKSAEVAAEKVIANIPAMLEEEERKEKLIEEILRIYSGQDSDGRIKKYLAEEGKKENLLSRIYDGYYSIRSLENILNHLNKLAVPGQSKSNGSN
ncbi:MAG: hypothetical protein NTZ68_01045 [Candidatus Dependentiae bacterium]|nr:hypothetical protein [Candidatus Dependentiae bacterium]